jgi:hypothetical protein
MDIRKDLTHITTKLADQQEILAKINKEISDQLEYLDVGVITYFIIRQLTAEISKGNTFIKFAYPDYASKVLSTKIIDKLKELGCKIECPRDKQGSRYLNDCVNLVTLLNMLNESTAFKPNEPNPYLLYYVYTVTKAAVKNNNQSDDDHPVESKHQRYMVSKDSSSADSSSDYDSHEDSL